MEKKTKKILYIFLHIPKTGGTTLNHHFENNFKKQELMKLYFNNKETLVVKEAKIQEEDNTLNKQMSKIKQYLKSLEKIRKNQIKIIYGHGVFYGIHKYFPNRNAKYITFIRHPINRKISLHDYHLMHILDKKFMKNKMKKELFSQRRIAQLNKDHLKNKKIKKIDEWLNNESQKNTCSSFLIKKKFIPKTDSNATIKKIRKNLNKFYFIGITENKEDFLHIYHLLNIKRFFANKNISVKHHNQYKNLKTNELILSKNKIDKKIYDCAINLNKNFKKKDKNFEKNIKNIKMRRNYQINGIRGIINNLRDKNFLIIHKILENSEKIYPYFSRNKFTNKK
ncbi:sulfotransferase family 2 domain-containing protein [bacterium]|nr:sulfotransferase family 2 domain-containing protein [bacterium]